MGEAVEILRRTGDVAVVELCGGPQSYDPATRLDMPIEDVVAGQALHIATDEIGWLRVANLTCGELPERFEKILDEEA